MKFTFKLYCTMVLIVTLKLSGAISSDITNLVFGRPMVGYIPAAFGDFNSDELTDVFMIYNDEKSIQIFTGSYTEPLLNEGPKCDYNQIKITSVVPGDFDGDAFMDVMFTAKNSDGKLNVYVSWGSADNKLNCSYENEPLIEDLIGEPMALDYNKDMIIDLFGLNHENERKFYIFHANRTKPTEIPMSVEINSNSKVASLKVPHSHGYLDINNDFAADLFLCTEKNYEIWNGTKHDGFDFNHSYMVSSSHGDNPMGQSLFLDFELKGKMNHIVPVCYDENCRNSSILVRSNDEFHDIHVNFKDNDNVLWGFVVPQKDETYLNVITLRGGDFNMDGYPDILVTLEKKSLPNGQMQTFLLENVPCDNRNCGRLSRTFIVQWKALQPFSNGTIMGAFYDFYQDGVLDVIFVQKTSGQYKTVAFRNTLDYDANFIKVIVLTGLKNELNPSKLTPLGRRKKTYGTNLPGPRIEYKTTTQEGSEQRGTSVQLPQSSYFSLHLPYTIFGLGRTPNFIDTLNVGLSTYEKQFSQVIPNSQMTVIPWPIHSPAKWKAQLFVTPSKLIIMSVFALGATCLVILFIILGLHFKEKREDKVEKLAEAHRFHFDAM